MHIDLDQQAEQRTYRAHFCVIGGGIAGLLLASRLAAGGGEVLLLEAGGLELEDRSQKFYEAEMAGERHAGTTEGRFRTFGGSSTRWGGQLLPYTEDVFAPPTGVASVAWPISESDVSPYYAELQEVLGTDALPFDASLLSALKRPSVPFSGDVALRFSKWIPFAKRNLGGTLGKAALEHPGVTVVSHANVAELTGSAGRIASARILDYAGREFRCEAEVFVVATGTIESSRLMLLSATAVPDTHAQMGHYFHDHVGGHVAEFESPERERMLEMLGPFFTQGTLHTCKMEASTELRAREHLPAVMAHVTVEEPEGSGAAAVRAMLQAVQRKELAAAAGRHLLPMLRGSGDVARLWFAAHFRQRRAVSRAATVRLNIDTEQPARAENCIRLSEATDSLGMRKAVVDWRPGETERAGAARFATVMRGELERLRIAPQRWIEPLQFADTFHPMGGLRMGDDPRQSVVDRDLRVHGMSNLYVASCAVYPSGGSSNPTFTLMALALRLADLLLKKDSQR